MRRTDDHAAQLLSSAGLAALRVCLESDPDADPTSLRTATDKTLAVGSDVWRLVWRNQQSTAVAGDAGLHTTCGALLDAFAVLRFTTDHQNSSGIDDSTVNLLVHRRPPGPIPSEVDQALRSLRDAAREPLARIWYRHAGGWVEDREPAPVWSDDDARIRRWLHRLLLPRLSAPPSLIALELVEAVDDPSLHLYPGAAGTGSAVGSALRLDGLQLGIASATEATLSIGRPGKAGDGPQRRAFIEVFGQPSVTVSTQPSASGMTVAEAAGRVRSLMTRFREADVSGMPIAHRTQGGVRVVDEHTLEARLLSGLIPLGDSGARLILDDNQVARGSQFPTLWGHGGPARYLDALLERDRTPVAVELKVASGGQGRYFRRSLIQAVLYRHFIRNSPGLDPWFKEARLNRGATEAAIGVPIPNRWTGAFSSGLDRLRSVASWVGVSVHVLDDRVTPERSAIGSLPEPDTHRTEVLSWRLASALASQWPRSLGRVVEIHDGGGQYEQLQLQELSDDHLRPPFPRPRVLLNRPGSVRVLSQQGSERWVWRGTWALLAAGGDPREMASAVGAVAGLGRPAGVAGPTFPELALAFLDAAMSLQCSWRCAWSDGQASTWLDRYRATLARYRRSSTGETLPTIARIWGAVSDGEAVVIVDQRSLRTWAWSDDHVIEVRGEDPLVRIRNAAAAALGCDRASDQRAHEER